MCVLGGAAGKNTLDDAGFGQGGTKVKFVILGRTELRVHGQSIDLGATKPPGMAIVRAPWHCCPTPSRFGRTNHSPIFGALQPSICAPAWKRPFWTRTSVWSTAN